MLPDRTCPLPPSFIAAIVASLILAPVSLVCSLYRYAGKGAPQAPLRSPCLDQNDVKQWKNGVATANWRPCKFLPNQHRPIINSHGWEVFHRLTGNRRQRFIFGPGESSLAHCSPFGRVGQLMSMVIRYLWCRCLPGNSVFT